MARSEQSNGSPAMIIVTLGVVGPAGHRAMLEDEFGRECTREVLAPTFGDRAQQVECYYEFGHRPMCTDNIEDAIRDSIGDLIVRSNELRELFLLNQLKGRLEISVSKMNCRYPELIFPIDVIMFCGKLGAAIGVDVTA